MVVTLLELLRKHNVPYREGGTHHHVREGWTGVDCWKCSPNSGRFRLGIPTDSPHVATCWICGRSNIVETLKALGVPVTADVWELVNRTTNPLQTRQERNQGALRLPAGIGPLLPCHRRYLERRGFNVDEVSKLWGVQGIGLASRLAWRLFIPIHYHGRVVSWTTRSIAEDATVRYVNAKPSEEAMPAKHVLYGADLARHSVVVVEGPTDAWNVGAGAVATLGLVYSREQLAQIAAFPCRAVVFDSSPEAQRRAERLCRELEVFPGRTLRIELDADDPGSATKREVRLLRKAVLR